MKDRLDKNEKFNFQAGKKVGKSRFLEGLSFRKSVADQHLKTVKLN